MSKCCTEDIFLRDVARHQMKILRDDGVNRHIRFKDPETSDMYFDLITWEGGLTYTGDMGTYVFQRLPDMFAFFRTRADNGEKIYINTGYWGEKCVAADRGAGLTRYSSELFVDAVTEWMEEQIEELKDEPAIVDALRSAVEDDLLSAADEGEQTAREAVDDFEFIYSKTTRRIRDFWEVNLQEKSYNFVWCCYAIAWGIMQYDKSKEERVKQ